MKSNSSNPCAGAFSDWLDVMLLKECNGKCSWCIEKDGYHPDSSVPVNELIDAIVLTGKKNIVLLGGEPTLYKDLKVLINGLHKANLNIYLTTNGSMLSEEFVSKNSFNLLKGLNISIHHYHFEDNWRITGIRLNSMLLAGAIKFLNNNDVSVRFNCNCFKWGIDTHYGATSYIRFAKNMGVKTVRFSEITGEDESFVNLKDIFKDENLPDCPFEAGCNHTTVIDGMNVIFRQMCGLQTSCRKRPENPEQKYTKNNVMYYDGKCHDGWLTNKKGESKMPNLVKSIVENLLAGEITKKAAIEMLERLNKDSKQAKIQDSSGGCHDSKNSSGRGCGGKEKSNNEQCESCHGPVKGCH